MNLKTQTSITFIHKRTRTFLSIYFLYRSGTYDPSRWY